MDDWELHFREKSRRRSKRLGWRYDAQSIGVILVALIAMMALLAFLQR